MEGTNDEKIADMKRISILIGYERYCKKQDSYDLHTMLNGNGPFPVYLDIKGYLDVNFVTSVLIQIMDISKAVPAQLMILFVFGGTFVSCSLDDASNSDVSAVKIRLFEERSKRLLLQNDVDTLMLRMEEMERTINGKP